MRTYRNSEEEHKEVVKLAPLVSIDLIVKDRQGRVLLGYRKKRPAKSTWFVPGGNIQKGEEIAYAFSEIVKNELGSNTKKNCEDARFIDVFEHFYDDNFAEIAGFGTHYVVLAYEISGENVKIDLLPKKQHSEWKWFTVEELLESPKVHKYTKKFFKEREPFRINEKQYPIVASSRRTHDTMLWQTPVLSLTAQAFLLTIALGHNTELHWRAVAAFLSLAAALFSIQLFLRHRYMEKEDSKLLEDFEFRNRHKGYAVIHVKGRQGKPSCWLADISSREIWPFLLGLFAVAALVVLFYCGCEFYTKYASRFFSLLFPFFCVISCD